MPARIEIKQGERVTDAHVRLLGAHLEASRPLAGRGVFTEETPWGTHYSYRGQGGSYEPVIFRPSVSRRGQRAIVKMAKGLIAGIEPAVNGIRISGDPETKKVPSVEIGEWNERGEAYIYFRLSFRADWTYEAIEMVATKDVPVFKPWTAWKLALVVFKDRGHWRALHCNLNHLAVSRKTNGDANHLFWTII